MKQLINAELKELRRLMKKHHRLCEDACHYGLTFRQEKILTRVEEEIRDIAKYLGFSVDFSGDTRGYTVQLSKDGGAK